MKRNYITRIGLLIPSLPIEDIHIGEYYFETRNLSSLKELVDSAIIRVKKERRKDNPVKYLDVELEELLLLKTEVDIYYAIVEGEDQEIEEEEENE